MSESLILLTKSEQPWAIRSGCSEEMSDVSESLKSLTKNDRMSEMLIFLSKSLIFGQIKSESLGNQMSEFPALQKNVNMY